jgi:hypothetical protein
MENTGLDILLNQSTDFSEVLPEPIEVTIVEYEEIQVEVDKHRKPIMRREPVARTTWINTYVPMRVFHQMMASQERIKRAQALNPDDSDQQAMIGWMTEQVLAVWRLTEPEMTLEALVDGLSFQKVLGLFSAFFGSQLKLLQQQAQ